MYKSIRCFFVCPKAGIHTYKPNQSGANCTDIGASNPAEVGHTVGWPQSCTLYRTQKHFFSLAIGHFFILDTLSNPYSDRKRSFTKYLVMVILYLSPGREE